MDSNNGHRDQILVVDASQEFLHFMELLLTAEGFAVETASSVEAAQAWLAWQCPDLLITDVELPGAPAFAMLHTLDRDDKWRDLPVLLCTGALEKALPSRSWQGRPHTDLLPKPFDIDDLLDRILRLRDGG